MSSGQENEYTILDRELGLKLAGNRQELADDMLNMFINSLPSDLDALRNAKDQNNLTEFRQLLHRLHGAASYCGVPRLKFIIASYETALKEGDTESFPIYFKKLEDAVQELIATAS